MSIGWEILQWPDLKTPYDKTSAMAVRRIFSWLLAKPSFKPISVLDNLCLLQRLATSCSLHSSCHGDVDVWSNHTAHDVLSIHMRSFCHFLTTKQKIKKNQPILRLACLRQPSIKAVREFVLSSYTKRDWVLTSEETG